MPPSWCARSEPHEEHTKHGFEMPTEKNRYEVELSRQHLGGDLLATDVYQGGGVIKS